MYVDLPPDYQPSRKTRSGLFAWFDAMRREKPLLGEEPIEVGMQMKKIDSNRVAVFISFQPMKEFMPEDRAIWRARCEHLYNLLRSYLMAS